MIVITASCSLSKRPVRHSKLTEWDREHTRILGFSWCSVNNNAHTYTHLLVRSFGHYLLLFLDEFHGRAISVLMMSICVCVWVRACIQSNRLFGRMIDEHDKSFFISLLQMTRIHWTRFNTMPWWDGPSDFYLLIISMFITFILLLSNVVVIVVVTLISASIRFECLALSLSIFLWRAISLRQW